MPLTGGIGQYRRRQLSHLRPHDPGDLHGAQHNGSLPLSVWLRTRERPTARWQSCARRAGKVNVIPASQLSPITQYMQKFLPTPTIDHGRHIQNNYLGGVPSGYDNWLYSGRIDYNISARQTLSFVDYRRQPPRRSVHCDRNLPTACAVLRLHGIDRCRSLG